MGLRSIRHLLHNPATGEEVDDLTQMVFDDTHALHAVFTEFDQAWRSCAISFEIDSSGRMTKSEGDDHPLVHEIMESAPGQRRLEIAADRIATNGVLRVTGRRGL